VDVLIPLGGDTIIRVRPSERASALVGIGSGVVVEHSYPEVEKILSERVSEMEKVQQRMIGNLDQLRAATQTESARLQQLYAEAQAIGMGPPPGGLLGG